MPTSFTSKELGKRGVLYSADTQSALTWSGYYLPLAAVSGEPKPTLTLEMSWSEYWGDPMGGVNGGCYVFFAQPPSPGAADALDALLSKLNSSYANRAYRYILWVPAPASGQPLGHIGAVAFVPEAHNSTVGEVKQQGSVALQTLEVIVPTGIQLEPGSDGESLLASPAGSMRLQLVQKRGSSKQVGAIGGAASVALGGAGAGVLDFGIEMTVSSQLVENDFNTLLVGVKYFYARDGIVKSQLYPILGVPSGGSKLPFSATLDPLNATDANPSRFTFQDAHTFSTSLVTTTGIALTLSPQPARAGLALARDKVTPIGSKDQIDSLYAVPFGDFTLGAGAPCPAGPLPLLCGISGLEAVSARLTGNGYAGDTLSFHIAQPAFAPSFPPQAVSLESAPTTEPSPPKLDTTITSSWVSIAPAQGGPTAQYYAQPHGAPLFGGGPGNLGMLPLLECPLGNATESFPLASYGSAAVEATRDGFDPALLTAFEQAILSPVRRERLAPSDPHRLAARTAADTGQTKAASPQGFIVTLDSTGVWSSLQLAQTVSQGVASTLELTPVEAKVQAVFQANQLALVATAAPWSAASFKNTVAIEGWPFKLAVGEKQSFGSYSNVMIAKFCHGTLMDLVADPKRWTDAADFNATANGELTAVSAWLQAYLKTAADSHDPAFTHFNTIVNDENWQGILLLRVDVPIEELPAQVGALRAGLPQGQFYAHHLGIEVSKVQADLTVAGSSSLFGLIDYIDPAYERALASGASTESPIPPEPGTTYDFRVLRLLVEFENSEVKSFQSKSQVTLNQWFGDPVMHTRVGTGGSVTNSIVIDGVLQRHDGQPVYLFSSALDTVFELDSNLLQAVEVLSTSLTTVSESSSGPSLFRFSFSGYLQFAAIAGLDVFSFAPAGTAHSGGGLAFAQLALEMRYDPHAAVPRTFTFTAERIAFDATLSNARTSSLFAAFPLTLKTLVVGGKGGLAQAGYLDVSLDTVTHAPLPEEWYGLLFDFDLGTPGALAAEAGWSAGLLVAWGAGSKRAAKAPSLAVGMLLPGAGGQSKMLSLQGVLKLSIEQIELTCPSPGAYLLRLTQIALHLLALQFPPSGSTALYLFGDPAAQPGVRSPMAWYAAYANPNTKSLAR